MNPTPDTPRRARPAATTSRAAPDRGPAPPHDTDTTAPSVDGRAAGRRARVDEAVKQRLRDALRHNQNSGLVHRPGHEQANPAENGATRDARAGCSSGKARFPHENAARARLAALADTPDRGRGYRPTGVHRCGRCRGWHLTSQTQKAWRHAGAQRGRP